MIAWEDYAPYTLTPEQAQTRLDGRCVSFTTSGIAPSCESAEYECYCYYVTRKAAQMHHYNYGYIK